MTGTYDTSRLRELTGPFLRPGGADLTRHGLALCGLAPGALVLDAGCGPGGTLGLLREAGLRPVGLDVSAPLLAEARASAPVLRADMAALPLSAGTLDGIVCECALSLAEDKPAVVRQFARALRPGGRLLLCDLVRRGDPARMAREKDETSAGASGGHAPGGGPQDGGAPYCGAFDRAAFDRMARDPGGIPCARGAQSPEALAAMLRESGLAVLAVEDRTGVLRELAARIVWHFGSLAAFAALMPRTRQGNPAAVAASANTTRAVPARADETPSAAAACGGRGLGYCLVVAEKR